MSGPLILSVCIFALILGLRIAVWKTRPVPSSVVKRVRLARVVALALAAFLAISMRLHRLNESIDGKPGQPQSWWQQILEKY